MNITTLSPDQSGLVDWPTLSADRKSIVTVGVFDGMHRGHRAVVTRVVELARQTKSFAVAIVFEPRPGMVHAYAREHGDAEPPEGVADTQELTSLNQRTRIMRQLGIDHVLVVRYTLAFAAKSYRFFLGQLAGKLGMRTLVLGSDAVMGAGRTGDVGAIETLAQATGVFTLDVVDDQGPGYVRIPAEIQPQAPAGGGEPTDPTAGMTKAELRALSKAGRWRKVRVWSSSNVRYLLSQGRIKDADEILGAPHGIEGTVVHGEQRGIVRIGFPTANLSQHIAGCIPVDGVYAGWVIDLGEGEMLPGEDQRLAMDSQWRWPAAISIGTKPTFSEVSGINERTVESYAITDEHLDLYGHMLRVEFAGFLRPQIKFAGVDELKAALTGDVEHATEITSARSSDPRP